MKLSAPIYRLKREAKAFSRHEKITFHEALDRIAFREGFASWSLLAAEHAKTSPGGKLYSQLWPGDLLLIAARPGQGKTLFSLELVAEALKAGHRGFVFSLEFTETECRELSGSIGVDLSRFEGQFEFDGTDGLDSVHIINRLDNAVRGTFVVIDYLQLLDQRRESPELIDQVRSLREFAIRKGLVLAFISQIDRSYSPETKALPDLTDVRLPNPLDLTLFDKTCFLNNGQVAFR